MLHRLLIPSLVLWALAAPAQAQQPPTVRYTTWMVVPGGSAIAVESRPYGSLHDDYTYRDQPTWSVLSLEGDVLERVDGKLGQTSTLAPAGPDPVLLRLQPGNNYAVPRPEAKQYWYVATPEAPLNVVRGFDALYFWLPPGLSAGTVLCHAFSPGEAGKLVVSDLDGNVLADLESDFNEPEALLFRAPSVEAPRGHLLQLSLLQPDNPDWTIDDAAVWLGPEIPGLLAPTAEAAAASRAISELVGIETDWTPLRDFEGEESPIMTVQWSKLVEEGAEPPAYDVALSGEQSFGGEQSLRVQMRFPDDYAEPWQQLKLFTEPLEVSGIRKVRFFLLGDGSGRQMTVRVRDAGQEHHYVDVGAIDWTGWKAVVADFEHATRTISGGDENRQINGPTVNMVVQINHTRDNPTESVLYIDDLAVQE